MRSTTTVVMGLTLAAAALLPGGDAQAQGGAAAVRDEIVRLTNVERARYGLAPLRVNRRLQNAAQAHAVNMARQNRMAHELDDRGVADRINTAGYRWSACAENIAHGYPSAAAVVRGWMNSKGHRANILNPNLTEIGVGLAAGRDGRRFDCQVFGTPR